MQAPAPPRLVEGGLPTEALVADVVVSKYAWHLPLYRQSQMIARRRDRHRSLDAAPWVGRGRTRPLYDRLVAILKGIHKLFADETRCPVLDPGRGKTKTGYLWAIARDDRPWGGRSAGSGLCMRRGAAASMCETLSPASRHPPGRRLRRLQQLTEPERAGGPLMLAYCWAHFRRQFYDIAKGGNAPIAAGGAAAHPGALQDRGRRSAAGRRKNAAPSARSEPGPLVES